jgi:hypothetical protein
MRRRKKLIIAAVLTAVVLAGSIGGVALAQTENGDDSQPKALFDRVAEILVGEGVDITSEQLKDAFNQARSEMQDEALDGYLQKLVDEGKIDADQAEQYKAWLQVRPDMEQYKQQFRDWQQARPDMPPELKDWQQARPDMLIPGPFGHFGSRGAHGGMSDIHGFGGPYAPVE